MSDERGNDTTEPSEEVTPSQPAVPRRRFLNDSWKVLGVVLVAEAAWTSYDLLKPAPEAGFYVTQYQGGLRALYQKCPHLGCKVPWDPATGEFKCPCHGSVYNLIGEYESGPAPRGMDRFPISIQNDHVMVDTSAFVEGPPPGTHEGPPPGPMTTQASLDPRDGGRPPAPSC